MMTMKKRVCVLVVILTFMISMPVLAKEDLKIKDTGIKDIVCASNLFSSNWEGISDVSQFVDAEGHFAFARETKKKVIVYHTMDGAVTRKVELKKYKKYAVGAVGCDKNGNYYVVNGKSNEGDDTTVNTIFLSKYSPDGKRIKTVGYNGGSGDSATKIPFDAGNCDIAVSDLFVAVNYAREMYNGHQSNDVWIVDQETMMTQTMDTMQAKANGETVSENSALYQGKKFRFYNSHSFGQRAITDGEAFYFASWGDGFPRAFSFSYLNTKTAEKNSGELFHFWVKKGTYTKWDMATLNCTFAEMGDLSLLPDGKVLFTGNSCTGLNKKSTKKASQIFVQIFDPKADLSKASAYVTTGSRSGLSGGDGNWKVTDYGVKWIAKPKKKEYIMMPQAATDENGNTVILFEMGKALKNYDKYLGVYAAVVDKNGNLIKKPTRISKKAELNECETPIYADGRVYWVANKRDEDIDTIKVYSYKF